MRYSNPMKWLITFLPLLIVSCSTNSLVRRPSSLMASDPVYQAFEENLKYLQSKQIESRYWSGAYVTDVTQDAFVLSLGSNLGKLSESIKSQILESIFSRMLSDGLGWESYPGEGYNFNVSGATLLCLKGIGIDEKNGRVSLAWEKFRKLGGEDKLNIYTRLHLASLGLIDQSKMPATNIKILGLPKSLPMNIEKLGLMKGVSIPYLTWRALRDIGDGSLAQDRKEISDWQKLKIEIGEYKKVSIREFGEKDPKPKASKDNWIMRTGNKFSEIFVGGSESFWSEQGIAWIIQSQNKNAAWYGVSFSLLNLMAINEAQRVGLGDFSQTIDQAWKQILRWRVKSLDGNYIQQPMNSDVWDTAASIIALNYGQMHVEEDLVSQESLAWLIAAGRESPEGLAWSFDSLDHSFPDVDDSAAAVHALVSSSSWKSPQVQAAIKKGLDWILDKQNANGGFPAWTKGVSTTAFFIFRQMFEEMPDIEDRSQADVTARVLHMLTAVDGLGIYSKEKISRTKLRACQYFSQNAKRMPGTKLRNFQGHWVSNYSYGASQALIGLVHSNCDAKWQLEIVNWLSSIQNQDGGWGESNKSYITQTYEKGPSTLAQTALVLEGLLEYYAESKSKPIQENLHRVIASGVDFLVQKTKGGKDYFEPDFTAVMVKGLIFNRYELVPAYASHYVLARWLELRNRPVK